MARLTIAERDALMAKRIRWENSQTEEKEFRRTMAEKLKRDLSGPETVGSFGKKKPKSKKKDPFEGMGMGSAFGMPIARYAYNAAEKQNKKKKPSKREETGI